MKNQPTRIKLAIGILCTCLLFFAFPAQSKAQTVSLKVTPSVFRIAAKPPADIWTPFTLENLSDQPISLIIGYKLFDSFASSNGNVVFLQDGQTLPSQDKKIFEKMQVVDDQNISHDTIDLGPQQKIRLRLRILLPTNEPVSDYYFSLIFLQNPLQTSQSILNTNIEDQKSFSMLQAGIGTTVLLGVGPKEAPKGSIQTFSAPIFVNSGPVPFTLSVHNSGNHFITPHGKILIKNIFGQTVGKVIVPPATILSGTDRTFSSTDIQTNASTAFIIGGNQKNTPQGLLWNENFLLGMYTATLTLTLSDSGPVYVRSFNFFTLPLSFLFEFLITILIIAYVYLRVKRRIR
jgi:hypothetical protein